MGKILFKIGIQSITDVITNSSSELFVINNENGKDAVIELIDSVLPCWRDDYNEPVCVKELEDDSIDCICCYVYDYSLFRGSMDWFNDHGIDVKVEDVYEIGKSIHGEDMFWGLNEHGYRMIKEYFINEMPNQYFIWSKDENPDWDDQETLMSIGSRYHLG